MNVFDQVDVAHLNRREWHLWLLAIAMIAILAAGMALLMYPSAFSSPLVLGGDLQRKAFFGFCGLSVLVVGYLVDREILIRNLRKEVEEERSLILQVRQKSSTDLLRTLPGLGSFQDRLTMEHHRAVSATLPLSVVLIVLTATQDPVDSTETSITFGDAAKALLSKIRGEDSIFLLSQGVFGVLLPAVQESDAYRISARLAEGLRDAAGVSNRFSFDIQTLSYPEHFKSAHEIECAVRPFLRTESVTTNAA
jgi:GGDEF domain-containing protein